MKPSALIIGSKSFIGGHLTTYLQAQGVKVHSIGRNQIDFIRKTVPEARQALVSTIADLAPDFIFHLAGLSRADQFTDLYSVNTLGTSTVLEAIVLSRTRPKVLVAGSAAEYGRGLPSDGKASENVICAPTSHYGRSKLMASQIAMKVYEDHGLPLFVARNFNVIGPGMPNSMVPACFFERLAMQTQNKSMQLDVLRVDSLRDFIDVRDAVAHYWSIIKNDSMAGQIVNICSGQAIQIGKLIDLIGTILDRQIHLKISAASKEDIDCIFGDLEKLKSISQHINQISLYQSLVDIAKSYNLEVQL